MKPKSTLHSKIHTSSGGIFSDIREIDMRDSIIGYEISRYEVENGLTERLVHDLRADAENPLIHAGQGSIVFWVSGYDEDPEEMFQIADFHNFIQKAHESNLCWIYFADPASYWPQIVAFCTSSNAQALSREGQSHCTLSISPPDFASFLGRQIDHYEKLCLWANISEKEAEKKLNEVFISFGIGRETPPERPPRSS